MFEDQLNALEVHELEQLIHRIHEELERRSTQPSEQDIVEALNFQLKRHRKRKDEVFNPFA